MREPRSDYHLAASAQQLERNLKADFDAPSCEKRVPSRQVAGLAPFLPVQGRARLAQRRVKGVKLRKLGLARVALNLRKWCGWM